MASIFHTTVGVWAPIHPLPKNTSSQFHASLPPSPFLLADQYPSSFILPLPRPSPPPHCIITKGHRSERNAVMTACGQLCHFPPPLTPSYAIVCPEWCRRVEDVGDHPGVEVGTLDKHPEDRWDVAVQKQDQDRLAEVSLQKKRKIHFYFCPRKVVGGASAFSPSFLSFSTNNLDKVVPMQIKQLWAHGFCKRS